MIISLLSLLGIFQTALIVGVLSETLVIPPDEKRILASVEKQSKNFLLFWSQMCLDMYVANNAENLISNKGLECQIMTYFVIYVTNSPLLSARHSFFWEFSK